MATPTSATSSQGPSFKTNVNRAKTKRWVEAKSYSYDGDDWGEVDDYDEYPGYNEPAPSVKFPGLRQRGQSTSQTPEARLDQNIYQSPNTIEPPGFLQRGASIPQQQQQQQHGGRHVTNQPAQPHPRSHEEGSFERGDGRWRAFSAGPVHHTLPEASLPGPKNFQQRQNIEPQDLQHGVTQFDVQLEALGRPRNNSGAVQPVVQSQPASNNSRNAPMTSTPTSSPYPDRRDFSPSAVPLPLHTRNSPSPHHDPWLPPRKDSIGQRNQPGLPFDPQAPPSAPLSDASRDRAGSSSSGGGLPFIRPADIYRRMEEERERERQSQESARPSMDAVLGRKSERPPEDGRVDVDLTHRKPTLESVTERKGEYGFEGVPVRAQTAANDEQNITGKRRTTSKTFDIPKSPQPPPSHSGTLSPSLTLPDPTRISGFGEGFGDSFMRSPDSKLQGGLHDLPEDSSARETTTTQYGQRVNDLRHQPSKGFTSAVHQAFDTAQDQVPPTPSSVADSSVARSSSGGTNAVSPIMSRGPSAIDRDRGPELPRIDDVTTPMQEEDDLQSQTRKRASGSFATLKQGYQVDRTGDTIDEPPFPGFKMGHRRNSSTPSPDNSPARTPMLACISHLRHPQEVDYAQTTPTPTDSVPSETNSIQESQRSSSPTKPFVSQQTDSSSGGRVRDLAERFGGVSRPDSAQSNTTPRASMLGPGSPDTPVQEATRPTNERLESFRPTLPGGWQSSPSIEPSSAAGEQKAEPDASRSQQAQQRAGPSQPPSPVGQSKGSDEDPSKSAFSAAAEAGQALAGSLTGVVGVSGGSARGNPSERRGADNYDDVDAPSPLPKDTPRPSEMGSTGDFPSSAQSKANTDFDPVSAPKQPSSLPPLSTRMPSGEYESDRLRREIVRELRPGMRSDPTTAESDSPYQPSSRYPTNDSLESDGRQSSGLPSDYNSYWNDEGEGAASALNGDPNEARVDTTAQNQYKADIPGKSDMQQAFRTQPQMEPEDRATPPPLARRFSWEQPLTELPPAKSGVDSASLAKGGLPSTSEPESPTNDSPAEGAPVPALKLVDTPSANTRKLSGKFNEAYYNDPYQADAPKLTIDTSSNQISGNYAQRDVPADFEEGLEAVAQYSPPPVTPPRDIHEPHTASSQATQVREISQIQPDAKIGGTDASPPLFGAQLPPPPPPTSDIPKLPAFREIMSLKSPQERIRTFKDTQSQFANMNTGLDHWLAATINAQPEHGDLIKSGGRSGFAGPGRESSPLGTRPQGQPHYQQYLDASSQPPNSPSAFVGGAAASNSQGLSPSGASGGKISTQQVQAKGKELLHTAGVFGGKANVAAKGLFSKGRSKLRDASSGKKAPTSIPSASDSWGMQSHHVASRPRSPIRDRKSLRPNGTDSEHETPSLQSTHSQLADDEWSVHSARDEGDRLPRSSKIFRKRDNSDKGKRKSREPPSVIDDGVASTPTELWTARVPNLNSEPPREGQHNVPVETYHDHYGLTTQEPTTSRSLRSSRKSTASADNAPRETKSADIDTNRRSTQQESHDIEPANPGSSTPRDGRSPIQIQDEQKKSRRSSGTPDPQWAPPSPISPDLPIQSLMPRRGRLEGPLHYGIEHNFLPGGDVEAERRRSRSFSRPFNRSESRSRSRGSRAPSHSSRRPSAEELAMPVGFYPDPITREEAQIPRPGAPEHSLEEARPPELPPKDPKPQSRRGSRSSAFFKSLTRTFTDSDSPSLPQLGANGLDGSPAESSTNLEKKSKRSSIFGLPRGRTDLAARNGKVKDGLPQRVDSTSRGSSNVTQLPTPDPPTKSEKGDDDEFPMRPKQRTTTGLSRKFQRSSTTASKEVCGSKGNRVSAIGRFFGRSSQRRHSLNEPSKAAAVQYSQRPSHARPMPAVEENNHHHAPAVNPQQAPYQYSMPKPPPTSGEPPLGGYYAPKQGSSLQPPPPAASNSSVWTTQRPSTEPSRDVPVYLQDSTTRQLTSPPPSDQGRKASRSSVDFFGKASHVNQNEASSAAQRHQSKGSAWHRFPRQKRPSDLATLAASPVPPSAPSAQQKSSSPTLPALPRLESFGHGINRYDSPPPPPPKDDWQRSSHHRPSPARNAPLSNQGNPNAPTAPYPSNRPSQGLPQLQTDVPSPHLGDIKFGFTANPPTEPPTKQGMTFEEKRRSRRWEIEQGYMSPKSPAEKRKSCQAENMSPKERRQSRQMEIEAGHSSTAREGVSPGRKSIPGGLTDVGEGRRWEEEEPIPMNATSFPGQEWRPHEEYAWGDR